MLSLTLTLTLRGGAFYGRYQAQNAAQLAEKEVRTCRTFMPPVESIFSNTDPVFEVGIEVVPVERIQYHPNTKSFGPTAEGESYPLLRPPPPLIFMSLIISFFGRCCLPRCLLFSSQRDSRKGRAIPRVVQLPRGPQETLILTMTPTMTLTQIL